METPKEEFELKYFTSNGREKRNSRFVSKQDLINFYYEKRKSGAGHGQWRKVEFKEFNGFEYNPNEFKLI